MTDVEYHNYLARAAWLLADFREYVRARENGDMTALDLRQRCDDYFSETYRWLSSQQETSRETLPTTAPPAEKPGLGWKGQGGLSSPSRSLAFTTETASTSEEASSSPSSGGFPSTGKKLLVDFF